MATTEPSPPAAPARPRFSWPMRIFLTVLLFDIIFRSLSVMFPSEEWVAELEMKAYPDPLPTRADVAEIDEIGGHKQVADRFMRSFGSIPRYLIPWPEEKTLARIDSRQMAAKYAFCWLDTRLEFFENVLGINEYWPMFSPDVSDRKRVARMKLEYADGTRQTLRLTADPPDLTHYSHWNQEKVLDYELRLNANDRDTRHGYCNYLIHKYPHNQDGAALVRIWFYEVKYYLPEPHEDAVQALRLQSGPPLSQVKLPFYVYDVAAKEGEKLNLEDDNMLLLNVVPLEPTPTGMVLGGLWWADVPKQILKLDE